jgi:hypothetical protein
MAVCLLHIERLVKQVDDVTEGEEPCPSGHNYNPTGLCHIQLKAESFGRTELQSSIGEVHFMKSGCKLSLVVYLEHDGQIQLHLNLPIINHLRLFVSPALSELSKLGFLGAPNLALLNVVLKRGDEFIHEEDVVSAQEVYCRVQSGDALPNRQRIVLSQLPYVAIPSEL